MNPKLRIPLAVLAGAVAVAAFWAVKPAGDTSSPSVAQAAEASTDPGVLAPFLRFAGTDSVKVKPDQAQVSVTATATRGTSQAAVNEASTRIEAVTAKLKSLGLADADLQSSVSSYQDWDSKDWTANITLQVTIHDVSRAGEILGQANAAGADAISGPYFTVENQDAAYAEAMKKAIENARSKAEAAAAQMGVRVTGVVSVDETPGSAQPPIAMEAAASDASGGATTDVPVQAGEQEIYASVTVVFTYAT